MQSQGKNYLYIRKDGNTMNMEKLNTKKELLTILAERIYPELERAEKDAGCDYKKIGVSSTQRKNWKTGELMFDENGDPIYEEIWDYVDKDEDEVTDKDKAKLDAIEIIRNALDRLI